jgi:hypothetical protein
MVDSEEQAGPLEIHLWTWNGLYFGSSDGATNTSKKNKSQGPFSIHRRRARSLREP